jgi:hypothetical protein
MQNQTVSYPLGDLEKKQQILTNDWLPEGYEFVRFGIQSKRYMFLRSLAYNTVEEYRESENDEKDIIVKSVAKQITDYFSSESKLSQKEISKNIVEYILNDIGKESVEKEKLKIHIPESGNILGTVFSLGSNHAYPFFYGELAENLRKKYTPRSKLFTVNGYENIKDYMYARIFYRSGKNELQKIEEMIRDGKTTCEYALSKTEEFKILKRRMLKSYPDEIVKLINDDSNFEYDDEEMQVITDVLRTNICILRAWSDNVSVEKYYIKNETYPTLLFFLIKEGYYGPDGSYTSNRYLPGSILVNGRLKYILKSGKDDLIIYQLMKYDITTNSSILESNYSRYIENQRKGIATTKTTELEEIDIPEYGRLQQLIQDDGDVDEISKIIGELDI